MERMADIRDELGNPIQLTDELGNPVVLTDEHGNPMKLTGVATKIAPTLASLLQSDELGVGGGVNGLSSDVKAGHSGGGNGERQQIDHEECDAASSAHVRSTTSGSSSSEAEDETSEKTKKTTKKKKGLTQKIKEKLTLTSGKHKEEQSLAHTTPTAGQPNEHHEKKGVLEKIKEKMPGSGHHHHHPTAL